MPKFIELFPEHSIYHLHRRWVDGSTADQEKKSANKLGFTHAMALDPVFGIKILPQKLELPECINLTKEIFGYKKTPNPEKLVYNNKWGYCDEKLFTGYTFKMSQY